MVFFQPIYINKVFNYNSASFGSMGKIFAEAGTELCQAHKKLGIAKASNKLRWSSSLKDIEVVFH